MKNITQKITLRHGDGARVCFASDFHFNHDRSFLWGKRGFGDVQEHDDYITRSIRESLTPNDALVYLGDLSLTSSVESTIQFLRCIPCPVLYVWGNHESFTSKIYDNRLSEIKRQLKVPTNSRWNMYPLSWEHVTFVGSQIILTVIDDTGKNRVFGSHFPHHVWDKSHHGVIHVCGHSHGPCHVSNPESTDEGKVFDVGVENAIRLADNGIAFTWDEIKMLSDMTPVKQHDHHDENTN